MSKAFYMPLSLNSKMKILKIKKNYLKKLTKNYKIERAIILTDIHDLEILIKEDKQKDGKRE